jgi:hypothetical protein
MLPIRILIFQTRLNRLPSYTCITLSLHCCYTVVTLLLHCCYTLLPPVTPGVTLLHPVTHCAPFCSLFDAPIRKTVPEVRALLIALIALDIVTLQCYTSDLHVVLQCDRGSL